MSFTFGYDLKDGDRILEARDQQMEILSKYGAVGKPINILPFCAVSIFFPACL